MKIVVAPDSFKGTLTSQQAALIIAENLSRAFPNADIVQCPLADGGEGTCEILAPLVSESTCLIESAQFIGLNHPDMCSVDLMQRGSGAIGMALIDALNTGRRDLVIALGGSATNDAGLGMLMALGMLAFNEQGKPVEPNLSGLLCVHHIDLTGLDPRLAECRLTILSDVVSPLCGKNGATTVYGPQKGLQSGKVDLIDRAVVAFADVCSAAFGVDYCLQAGAGAAGGLGFALMLLGGKVVSGADFVMTQSGLLHEMEAADWVITGEGCSDAQTLQGKLPYKVALAARESGTKVALLSGSVDMIEHRNLQNYFDLVIPAKPDGMEAEEVMAQASSLLKRAVIKFAETIS